jgi:hypothetical protein
MLAQSFIRLTSGGDGQENGPVAKNKLFETDENKKPVPGIVEAHQNKGQPKK